MNIADAATITATHPFVANVQVTDDGLRVWAAAEALALAPVPGQLLREYLDYWAELYDFIYTSGRPVADGLDLSGWKASDTGKPFSTEHMTDWIDCTVELVLRGRPQHILELGCGTGLLLRRLHSHIASYVGTDVSAVTVERLAKAGLPRVAVIQVAAHEVATSAVRRALDSVAGPGVRPDCVLINSVTQHFPHGEYLRRVLIDSLSVVSDGGLVLVGDVRHAGLLPDFCMWLERSADPEADPGDLARRAAERAARETELLADPRFILDAASSCDRPIVAQIHPRTMAADSELTRYRYDVVLRVGRAARPLEQPVLNWEELPGPDRCAALRTRVVQGAVEIRAIPNGLLLPESAAMTPSMLIRALTGLDASLQLEPENPLLLRIVTPSERGWVAATPSPVPRASLLHEPMKNYVRRRLPELLHDHLHRTGVAITGLRITIADSPL